VGPAAVRLAQLALLRERPDDAAALLEPVARGQAGEPARGLAGYWLARARLARRDAAGACAALTAAAGPAAVDADLTRQLATLRQRVPDCGGAVVAVGPSGTTGTAATPVAGGAPSPAPRPGAPRATSEPTPPRDVPADAPAPSVSTQRDVATAASAPPGGSTPAAAPPARPRSGEAEPDRTGAPPRPAPLAAAPVGRGGFSVQVAAYDTRAGADALTTQLRASGLDAFTEGQGPDGQAPPFRVKVGRHATRAAALEELAALRGRGVTGFVTSARPAAASGTR
jgi:cell division septation protein DedD